MANPVALYAAEIAPRPRGAGGSGQVIEAEFTRSGSRTRGAESGRRYDAYVDDNVRNVEFRGDDRVRRRQADPRRTAFDDTEAHFVTGRKRASASLSFLAQQIAQEKLSPGAHFENYSPALNAYAMAAGPTGAGPTSPGMTLSISV